MWDRMQFLFRNYYDRMIHFYLHFDKPLDFKALSKAYKYIIDRIGVLHSSFVNHPITPYWKVNYDYSEEDFIVFKRSDDQEKDAFEFLTQEIPVKSKLQIESRSFAARTGATRSFRCSTICAWTVRTPRSF